MYKRLTKDIFFEMSNLPPDDTGLPFVIWISPKSGKEKHWARIKVEYNNILYPMSIDDSPEWKISNRVKLPFSSKQTQTIKEFVKLNKDILLSYWNSDGMMSMRIVIEKLKKV